MWPWKTHDNKERDDMPRFEDDNLLEDTDELEDDELEDDLSDIDEDTKARFDKYAAKQQKEYDGRVAKLQESLGSVGLGVSDDGQVSIRNLQTVQSYFAPLSSNQQVRTTHTEVTEDEDDWADPVIEPDKYEKKLSKAIEKATEPYKQQIQHLQNYLVEDKIEQAVDRVENAVNKHAPLYAEILEHPQFETTFREVLATMPMENWRDSRNLAKIVGMIGVDLSPVEKQQKRSQQRVAPQEQVRSDFNRKQLGQISPSKGSASKTAMDFDDVDRILAEKFDIPLEQARALGAKSDPDSNITPERLYREARVANGKRR